MRRTAPAAAFVLAFVRIAAAATDRYGLYVVPRAVDVDRKVLRIKHSVMYYVPEAYPAHETLNQIKQSLADAGWRPARCSELGKSERSSHAEGWQDLPNSDGSSFGRFWSGTWVNTRGQTVHYLLAYRPFASGGLRPTHVQVAAWFEDKEEAEQRRKTSDRHLEQLLAKYPYLRVAEPCLRERAGEQ
jgi:hypothetical protein